MLAGFCNVDYVSVSLHLSYGLESQAGSTTSMTICSIGFCGCTFSFYLFIFCRMEGEGRGGGEGKISNILLTFNGKNSDSEMFICSRLNPWSSLNRHDFDHVHACRFMQCLSLSLKVFCRMICSVCEMWHEIKLNF